MKDWDDIRFFLAVAREGTMSGGAKLLGVNQSTVSRRIVALEERYGTRLLEKLPTGYVLTPAGETLIRSAESIEEEMANIDRQILGQDSQLMGSIHITTVDTLAQKLLAPMLTKFLFNHPEIEIELSATYDPVSLSKREADVALRASKNPPENLVGRRLAKAAYAIYGSNAYLDKMMEFHALQHMDLQDEESPFNWIGWDDEMTKEKWLGPGYPKSRVRCRVNSISTMFETVRAGMGLAQMPCFMGDADSSLRRLSNSPIETPLDIWLLTHADLRQTAKIRVFMDFLSEEIMKKKDLIEGREPLLI